MRLGYGTRRSLFEVNFNLSARWHTAGGYVPRVFRVTQNDMELAMRFNNLEALSKSQSVMPFSF